MHKKRQTFVFECLSFRYMSLRAIYNAALSSWELICNLRSLTAVLFSSNLILSSTIRKFMQDPFFNAPGRSETMRAGVAPKFAIADSSLSDLQELF